MAAEGAVVGSRPGGSSTMAMTALSLRDWARASGKAPASGTPASRVLR
jgi:hypothetical protein